MCYDTFNPRLSPVMKQQVDELQLLYPKQASFIKDIYEALTYGYGLAAQVNLLILFTLLRHQYQKNTKGILARYNLLYVPLSILAKTGERIWTRFRPQAVKELHTSFLSFMMAETNRNAVNRTCNKYGLAFGQAHCCGVLFGAPHALKTYQESELYHERNFLRSSIESLAMPIEETSFDNIPETNSDLGKAEQEFFDLYEQTCQRLFLPEDVSEIPASFLGCVNATWENVLSVTPTAKLLSV